jgi:uncharacterized OsmC-like protein
MALTTFKTDVAWQKQGVAARATARSHTLTIDEPPMLGGADQGPTPVEYLLAALGGCLSVVIAALAPAHHVTLEDLTVHVEGDMDLDGFRELQPVRPGFQAIRVTVEVASSAPAEAIAALVEHAERVCPVKDTLAGVPVVCTLAAPTAK